MKKLIFRILNSDKLFVYAFWYFLAISIADQMIPRLEPNMYKFYPIFNAFIMVMVWYGIPMLMWSRDKQARFESGW